MRTDPQGRALRAAHLSLVALACMGAACGSDPPGASSANGGGAASSTGDGAITSSSGQSSSSSGRPSSSGATGGASASSSSGVGGAPTTPNECASPEAEWIFCSDFEPETAVSWDDYDGNPDATNHLMSDPGPFALADNHVMRLRAPAGNGGADMVKMLPPHDKLYARWYLYYEPGFDLDAPNHGAGLNAGSHDNLGISGNRPQGDDYFGSWLEYNTDNHRFQAYTYYRGMYQDCADPNGSCWGDHFPCMYDTGQTYCTKPQDQPGALPAEAQTGKWTCIEMMIDAGAPAASEGQATGVLDYWIDGAEIGPWQPLWWRTTASLQVDILWLSLFFHQDHSVEGEYFDNVVVSTARVGCP